MPTGQSARIKAIHYHTDTYSGDDITVTIDRKKMMFLDYVAQLSTFTRAMQSGYKSIAEEIHRLGLWPVIPLGEGQTLGITAPGAGHYIQVVYDLYEGGDVTPSEPNGSQSSTYRLFQQISNSGVRATAGDLALDQSDIDAVFPAFPGGESVPAKTTMTLLALYGSGYSRGTGAANGEYTTYLKMLKDREDILDQSLTGMVLLGDASYTTASVDVDTHAGLLWTGTANFIEPSLYVFDPPIDFTAGEELNVYMTLARTGAGGDFVAGDLHLGMIFDVQSSR